MRLGIVARMLRSNFDRQVSNLGVTRSQWHMVAIVARWPGATQRVIAEKLEMSEASAGRLIDRLCSEGLLERRSCQNDRRARAVFLTDAAEPMLAKLSEVARSNEELIFAGFSDEDMERFTGLIDRVYDNVSRI